MRVAFVLVCLFLLSSCASFKKSLCDCSQTRDAHSVSEHHRMSESRASEKSSERIPEKAANIVVDSDDIAAGHAMLKAVDSYVFKNQKDEFLRLCQDPRFDCFVNEKRFPKGRKKIKRKVSPYMSGSKLGTQDDKQIRVKYDFYP